MIKALAEEEPGVWATFDGRGNGDSAPHGWRRHCSKPVGFVSEMVSVTAFII